MECILLPTLHAMYMQEDAYRIADYFGNASKVSTTSIKCFQRNYNSTTRQQKKSVDLDCRYTMAEWCYKIVDFCKYSRETASIAMCYVDRFLGTQVGQRVLLDRSTYQLTVITCLYTAVKLFEPVAISPDTFAALSHGSYTAKQIEDLEKIVLNELQWRMNPPTAIAFLHQLIELIPSHLLNPKLHKTVLDLAKIQIELSVYGYQFALLKQSVIAMSSLLNAIESIVDLPYHEISLHLSTTTIIAPCIDHDSLVLERTRSQLFEMIEKRPGGISGMEVFASDSSSSAVGPDTDSDDDDDLCYSVHHTSPKSIIGMR